MIPRVFISKGEKSMNIQEKKHIVQKLLSGTLSDEEKAWLTQSPEMEQMASTMGTCIRQESGGKP